MAQSGGLSPEQDAALRALAEQGTLTQEQASAVRTALLRAGPSGPRPGAGSVFSEVAGYLGGALIIGGAGLMLGLNYTGLSHRDLVLVLVGYALALVLAAMIVAGGPARMLALRDGRSPVRRRLVGTLLAISAVPAALATGVGLDTHETSTFAALGFGATAVAVGALVYAVLPTVPAVLVIAAASPVVAAGISAVYDAYVEHGPRTGRVSSLVFLAIGVLWAAAAATGLVKPRELSYAVAAVLAIIGGQVDWMPDSGQVWAYSVTFVVALAGIAGYWLVRAVTLLVAGVVAATIAITEAVSDWSHGALSGPAIMLVAGVVLVGLSSLGLWLRSVRTRGAYPPPTPR